MNTRLSELDLTRSKHWTLTVVSESSLAAASVPAATSSDASASKTCVAASAGAAPPPKTNAAFPPRASLSQLPWKLWGQIALAAGPLGEELGEGTFGTVRAGHLAEDPAERVAIKIFDRQKERRLGNQEAFEELMHYSVIGAHPNIIRCIDAGILSNGAAALVFELARTTLLAFINDQRGNPEIIEDTRDIMQCVLQGLQAIHAKGYIHADVKPGNILLLPAPPQKPAALRGPRWVAKIGDLGVGTPRARSCRHATAGMLIGTELYRAPELCGEEQDCDFDAAVDLWAVGVVILELGAGYTEVVGREGPLKQRLEHLRQITLPELRPQLLRQLGHAGWELLTGLLEFDPLKRLDVDAALAHDYFHPWRLRLVAGKAGNVELRGDRSVYSLAGGTVAPEILHRWRADIKTLTAAALERAARGEDVSEAGITMEDEAHQVVLHGRTQELDKVKAMCGQPIDRSEAARSQALFIKTWKKICKGSLERLDKITTSIVQDLERKDRQHPNAKFLLQTKVRDRFAIGTQSQQSQRLDDAPPEHPSIVKPGHHDGANSLFHAALSNYGCADIHFWREKPVKGTFCLPTCPPKCKRHKFGWSADEPAPIPDVILTQRPGDVYMGNLTAAFHQVRHRPDLDKAESSLPLLQAGGKNWSSRTMVRSAFFPEGRWTRSRLNRGTPIALWEALNVAHARWLRDEVLGERLRLPTLAEMELVEAESADPTVWIDGDCT